MRKMFTLGAALGVLGAIFALRETPGPTISGAIGPELGPADWSAHSRGSKKPVRALRVPTLGDRLAAISNSERSMERRLAEATPLFYAQLTEDEMGEVTVVRYANAFREFGPMLINHRWDEPVAEQARHVLAKIESFSFPADQLATFDSRALELLCELGFIGKPEFKAAQAWREDAHHPRNLVS